MATSEQYIELLQNYLPPGRAWPREPDADLTRLIGALADALARDHNRALDLIEEADPRTTLELLPDWERVAGLPGPCGSLADTLQERRNQLVAQITARGGQSPQFYIDVAAALGFTVTVTEFKPFLCGQNACGDPIYSADWRLRWLVNGPEVTVREFRCGQSTCGEPLRDWGNEILECVISRISPAHTEVGFTYGA